MPGNMPAIDQSTCRGWSELQRDLYNAYPFWLAKTQVNRRKGWMTFSKMVKKIKWRPNMGPTMRGVRTNPSPILRQQVRPYPISVEPKADINRVTETTSDTILYWQDFETPSLNFLPDFQDFMTHVKDHGQDMMRQIERFEELFYRTMMFHMCPFLYIAKGNTLERINTTPYSGTEVLTDALGKGPTLMANIIANHAGAMTHLTLPSLAGVVDDMSTSLGVPPFQGDGMPAGDDQALRENFCLITHGEAYRQFTFDPYTQNYKNCEFDVVNGSFKGKIFGNVTSKHEYLPMFFKEDGTQAEPELEMENNLTYNENEPVPNPEYAEIANSGFAISWVGGEYGYDGIEVGPPPAAFTGNTPPRDFPAMEWNGEVRLTKNFLIECPDPDTGEIRYKTNSKGRNVRYEATGTFGIFPRTRRNLIPILHRRKRGV